MVSIALINWVILVKKIVRTVVFKKDITYPFWLMKDPNYIVNTINKKYLTVG